MLENLLRMEKAIAPLRVMEVSMDEMKRIWIVVMCLVGERMRSDLQPNQD